MTSKVIYEGDLRTISTHILSGNESVTDAPLDNNGKGEAFSPTDLVANSLATCMLTIMGIKAEQMGVDMKNSTAEVTKTMTDQPRRIAAIEVVFNIKGTSDEKEQQILEKSAMTCPVILSLHPDIEKRVHFNWI